jgi:hypothetical protein
MGALNSVHSDGETPGDIGISKKTARDPSASGFGANVCPLGSDDANKARRLSP